jgi:hypothetical protein
MRAYKRKSEFEHRGLFESAGYTFRCFQEETIAQFSVWSSARRDRMKHSALRREQIIKTYSGAETEN